MEPIFAIYKVLPLPLPANPVALTQALAPTIDPIFAIYKAERISKDEPFGTCCHRLGNERIEKFMETYKVRVRVRARVRVRVGLGFGLGLGLD